MKLLIVADLAADTEAPRDDIALECWTVRSIDVALLDDSDAALALARPRLKHDGSDPWHGNREPAALLVYVGGLFANGQTLFQVQPQSRTTATDVALSPRECSILELIAEGHTNKEIARLLGIAPETVKSHVKHLFGKLAVDKRAQAISRAQRIGLVRTNAS